MFENVQPIIGPYSSRPAVCREYDPRAAEVARLISAAVRDHLPQVCVEHVGSTSVPGCAGKGIVDLMITVRDDDELARVKELLQRLGFQPQTGREPFPETRPMRVGSLTHGGEEFLLHVHVVPAGSSEVDEMRFFRACLRSDADLRKAYVAKKREIIAAGVTDSLDYCHAKDEWLKQVFG